MIKEILEQLAPLDAQIAALKGRGNDMEAITAHASELAELAVEEDEILRTCGPLTAGDRVFLARHPERPHIGHRPPEGCYAGRKSGLQLWYAGAGGLPQGTAPDEAG